MDAINRLIETGLFEDAVKRASAEIQLNPTSAPMLRLRSVAYARLGEPQKALLDAEEAVRVCCDRHEMPFIQLRRAIALFGCKRAGEAKCAIRFAAEGWPKDASSKEKMLLEMWQAKIEQSSEAEVIVPRIPPESVSEAQTESIVTAPKLDWYQTKTSVVVCIYSRDLPADTEVKIFEKLVQISAPQLDYALWLSESIDPQSSSYELSSVKIELNLKKRDDLHWKNLEPKHELSSKLEDTTKRTTQPADVSQKPKLASFEKKWEIDDDSDEDKDDPMALFRSIYEKADPETRRAMNKSYQESHGTALSTNWSEVSKKPVEAQFPPDFEPRRN